VTVPDIAARVGNALLKVRSDAGLAQEDMAERLDPLLELDAPISQSWVSRREKGITEARPSEIDAWEHVTGTRPGTVYRVAGLIDPGELTKSTLAHDPQLLSWQRRSMLLLYEEFLQANVGESDS
jgi:transcriptional regulator with XRE-family HTH domain